VPYQQVRTPIGKRRERGTLQRRETSDDGLGGQTPSSTQDDGWVTVCRPWYRPTVLDERANESLIAAKITARQAYHFDMRFREDVYDDGHAMRMLYRGKTLSIHTVADDEGMRRRLILLCTETQ
jgi:SPP1 family predicted phage head-tail adaptor